MTNQKKPPTHPFDEAKELEEKYKGKDIHIKNPNGKSLKGIIQSVNVDELTLNVYFPEDNTNSSFKMTKKGLVYVK